MVFFTLNALEHKSEEKRIKKAHEMLRKVDWISRVIYNLPVGREPLSVFLQIFVSCAFPIKGVA